MSLPVHVSASRAARLARLEAWLGGSTPSDDIDAVLRSPWEHLEHQARGAERVRATEIKRLHNAASSEDRVRTDYTGRFAIELLQNAHDACADAGISGQAWLTLTSTALVVANQGVPFDAERVDSLM